MLKSDGIMITGDLYWSDHTPHWKRGPHPGQASVRLSAHAMAKWLTFDTTEVSIVKGRKATVKRTLVTLDKAKLQDLADILASLGIVGRKLLVAKPVEGADQAIAVGTAPPSTK